MRKFLGEIGEFKEEVVLESGITIMKTNKQKRAFNERMLKAYLKGKEYFYYGFRRNPFGDLEPIKHKVLQEA